MSHRKSLSAKEQAALEAQLAAQAPPPPTKPLAPPPSVLDQLLHAVIHGERETVESLLTRRNSNFADQKHSLTLLMWSVEANEKSIAELLLKHGALQHLTDPSGFTALHRAAQRKNDEMIKLLLRFDSCAENVNIQSSQSRRTPLILGAMQGALGVVEALLGAGAKVDMRDSAGMSGIDHAAFRGYEKIVKLLAESGASCNSALYFASDGAKHAMTSNQKEQYEGLVRFLYAPLSEQSVVIA